MNRKKGACHCDQLVALRRIEGQIRGIQQMIVDERYCVDILNAIAAVVGALRKVESEILKGHLHGCVQKALSGKSQREKEIKLAEVCRLLEKLRK